MEAWKKNVEDAWQVPKERNSSWLCGKGRKYCTRRCFCFMVAGVPSKRHSTKLHFWPQKRPNSDFPAHSQVRYRSEQWTLAADLSIKWEFTVIHIHTVPGSCLLQSQSSLDATKKVQVNRCNSNCIFHSQIYPGFELQVTILLNSIISKSVSKSERMTLRCPLISVG